MTTNHILHKAGIKNNCPECFANDGLEFIFSQNHTVKKLYTSASKDIEEKLFCHSCKNIIYPVNWDDNIDRVYDYNKKQVVPKKGALKLTTIGFLIVFIGIAIIGIGVFFLLQKL